MVGAFPPHNKKIHFFLSWPKQPHSSNETNMLTSPAAKQEQMEIAGLKAEGNNSFNLNSK